MSLFNLGMKKEEEKAISNMEVNKSETSEKSVEATNQSYVIKVLGSGCAKCNELELNVKKALEQMGLEVKFDHITDFSVIAAYGVMSTPALVVNEKVVSFGKVLKVSEAIKLFQKIMN